MQGKKTVDWNAVDWSQQNRDIAEQFQVSPNTVHVMRKRLRKPRPKLWHKHKDFQARLELWNKLDWRETNASIGRIMKVSAPMAHYMRRLLGKPRSTISERSRRLEKAQELLEAKLAQLRGQPIVHAVKILGMSLATGTKLRRLLDEKDILRDGRRKYPREVWHLLNFDLGNTTLARIWGIRRSEIAHNRLRHKRGPAKWSGRIYHLDSALPESEAFLRAVQEEQAKARSLGKSGVVRSLFQRPNRVAH